MTTLSRIGVAAYAATLLTSVAASDGAAQIRGSEAGSVSQTLDGTTISLAYSRPSARGRELFGALVPWDVVWTPGANWATTLETNRDVRLNGVDVPAGTYSVWMIPHQRAEGPWTLTLNPETKLFHFQKPDSADGQIHIAVQAEEAAHTEMLTWSFPAVSGDAAVLQMRWGTTALPVDVLVEPTKATTLAQEDRAPYLGTYDLAIMDGIGYPTEAWLEVSEGPDGMLRGRMPFPIHPGDELEFDLVPAGMDRFNPGMYHGDRLFNIEVGVTFEFDVKGHAKSVVFRGVEGTAFGEGTRTDANQR
jgi:hypothetical protein